MKIIDYAERMYGLAYSKIDITDREIRVQHFEDVTALQESNRRLKAKYTPQDLTNKQTGWRLVGRIPCTTYLELMRKNNLYSDGTLKEDGAKVIRRFLNDPAYRDFNLGGKV